MDNNPNLPKVTIGVPTLNRAKLLSDCLESCLSQTYQNFEIVISNNASSDNTEEIVKGINDNRIQYHSQSCTISAIDNWNYCINSAKGEYFTFVSDDDILEPSYIEELMNLSKEYPNASLWRCGLRSVDIDNNILWEYSQFPEFVSPIKFIENRIQTNSPQFLPGFLCKTENMKEINGFEDVGFPGALYSDDYFWFRLSFFGEGVVSTNQILWNYRTHLNHMGAFIDIEVFNKNVPNYINLLTSLIPRSESSSDLLDFIKYHYPERLITDRLKIEMKRQSRKSKLGYALKIPLYFGLIKKYKGNVRYQEIFGNLL